MRYRPDIDGLRALAVLLVVGFHFDLVGFHAGFAGVDIFFVISGFLITSIVAKKISSGSFSLLSFYARRIQRIFPPLFLICGVFFILAVLFLSPVDLKQHGLELLFSSLFISNFLFYSQSGYFDLASEEKLFLHTWSLSVEEQYYLFWPLLLLGGYFLYRRYGAGWITSLFVFAALALFGLSVWLVEHDDFAAFYMLYGRAFELMAGAGLALWLRSSNTLPSRRIWAGLAALAGSVLLLLALWRIDSSTPFPGLTAVPVVLASVLLIFAGASNSLPLTSRILSLPPLVFIGKISYGLYLWHWPLYVFFRHVLYRGPTAFEALAIFLLSVLLSSLSLYLVENPVRAIRGRAVFFVGGGIAVSLLFAMLGAGAFWFNRQHLSPDQLTAEMETYVGQKSPLRKDCLTNTPNLGLRPKKCLLGLHVNNPSDADFFLIGDSHADHWAPGLMRLADERRLSGVQLSSPSCLPIWGIRQYTKGKLYEPCEKFRRQAKRFLSGLKGSKTIILAARWSIYIETTQFLRPRSAKWFVTGKAEQCFDKQTTQKAIFEGLRKTIQELTALGHRVIVIGQPPEYGQNQRNCVLAKIRNRIDPNQYCGPGYQAVLERLAMTNKILTRAVAQFPSSVQLVLPHKTLCSGGRCRLVLDDVMLYRDDDHLNARGSELVIKRLSRQLALYSID